MVLTIFLFVVLILSFIAMFGFVKFAENVIARPQLAPVAGDAAKASAATDRSL
jgi:hypothetical protein